MTTTTAGFKMKCPRFPGQAECGKALCAYCSEEAPGIWYGFLVGTRSTRGMGLIGRVAADVWDEKTVNQHILDMDLGLFQAGALRRVIALSFNEHFDAEGYAAHNLIEQQHTCMGMTHEAWVVHLRDLAASIDPHEEDRTYGKARNLR